MLFKVYPVKLRLFTIKVSLEELRLCLLVLPCLLLLAVCSRKVLPLPEL